IARRSTEGALQQHRLAAQALFDLTQMILLDAGRDDPAQQAQRQEGQHAERDEQLPEEAEIPHAFRITKNARRRRPPALDSWPLGNAWTLDLRCVRGHPRLTP